MKFGSYNYASNYVFSSLFKSHLYNLFRLNIANELFANYVMCIFTPYDYVI